MNFSEFVESQGRPAEFAAGEHIFRQGGTDRAVYVLRSGLLKAYYLSPEGTENVKSFILPGELIGSLASAYRGEGCSFNLVCVEKSTVIRMDFEAVLLESGRDLEMAQTMIEHLLQFAMKKEQRERDFLTKSAEDRYRKLVLKSPELLEKLRQKEIARYLGITPVALSRIRKRIAGG